MLGAFGVTPSHRNLGGYNECTFYFLNASIGMHVGVVCVQLEQVKACTQSILIITAPVLVDSPCL